MRPFHKTIAATSVFLLPLFSRAQVVINEVCAANWDLLMADGEYEDWIELYNAGGGVVDLSGFFLSDKASDPGKWPIPAGTTIPANGHLLFFASKKDGFISGQYHTNFKLTAAGAYLALTKDNGAGGYTIVPGAGSDRH